MKKPPARRSLDEAVDTYKEHWYKKIPMIAQPQSGQKKELRMVGGVFEVGQHWFRPQQNSAIQKSFAVMCLRWDLEKQEFREDRSLCPLCHDFSDDDLPEHLKFKASLTRYVEAFDLSRITNGDKTEVFGVCTPNKYAFELFKDMKDDYGALPDDLKKGYSIVWKFKNVKDPNGRHTWTKGRFNNCPVAWDKKRGVYVLSFKGKEYTGEPVDFNAIVEAPTLKEVEETIERLGLYAQLEEETGKMPKTTKKTTKKAAAESKKGKKKRREEEAVEDEEEEDEDLDDEDLEEEDEDLDEDEGDEEEDDEDEEEDDEDEDDEEEDDEDDEEDDEDEDDEEDDEDEDDEDDEEEDDEDDEEEDDEDEEEDEDLDDLDDENWDEDDEDDEKPSGKKGGKKGGKKTTKKTAKKGGKKAGKKAAKEKKGGKKAGKKAASKKPPKAEKPPKGKRRVSGKKETSKKATVKNPKSKKSSKKRSKK